MRFIVVCKAIKVIRFCVWIFYYRLCAVFERHVIVFTSMSQKEVPYNHVTSLMSPLGMLHNIITISSCITIIYNKIKLLQMKMNVICYVVVYQTDNSWRQNFDLYAVCEVHNFTEDAYVCKYIWNLWLKIMLRYMVCMFKNVCIQSNVY